MISLLLMLASASTSSQASHAATMRHRKAGALRVGVRPRPRCSVTERAIVGEWSDDSVHGVKDEIFPQGDSREIQFRLVRGRHVYLEYLHQHPGGSGRWSFKACRLSIVDHGATERFRIISQRGDRLILREIGQRETQKFHRIK